jgi:hypothetical protein
MPRQKLEQPELLRTQIKFEGVAATESVSLNGFLCTSTIEIPLLSVVDVSMTGNGNAYVGKASITKADPSSHRFAGTDAALLRKLAPGC